MLQKRGINAVTFLLSCIAGYCDTVTFVKGDSIFSAHVTGNFITFAAQAIKGGSPASWIKLITFPVFVAAVIVGGWLIDKTQKKYHLLLLQSVLLMLSGAAAIFLPAITGPDDKWCIYTIVMTVVFAMGLQNAFGKLFAKETHGPTTMMTGNVTQASLDLGHLLRNGFRADVLSLQSLQKQSYTIGGFLCGCLFGALLAGYFGLGALLLPGVAMLICYLTTDASPAG
ncbi:Uncharacterized membrane protein YoaK, UPF0700 family [Filimonas lacunae]|uniref:Uncharacterized membrane protein YoaK, UPF0700 family n=1 Tax=Filimonas lacunae TaxID=477680 RepID=A0A173MG59_9BACT|nr:YoaK family protein [Filimonas lacunae]BAV06486.1 DUF1275 domain-containing protein [Filimonas lacunae]SIT27130.1 Uncharacterized membrane protein YoaK, UPF0700 family [Filimonas lacunae]